MMSNSPSPNRGVVFVALLLVAVGWVPAAAQSPRWQPPTGLQLTTPEQRRKLVQAGLMKEIDYIVPAANLLGKGDLKPLRISSPKGVRLYSLPASVDLSLTGFLPPAGDQGGLNSCAYFSTTYYYKTYQECREHGWAASDINHRMSPAFTVNLDIGGGPLTGAALTNAPSMMVAYGCPPWPDMPYDGIHTSAMPAEMAWRHAIPNRLLSFNMVEHPLGDDTFLANIKQNLANGDPVVIAQKIGWNFVGYTGADSPGVNNQVLFAEGTQYANHALTVVGYDDNKTYNDGTGIKKGAVKVINSWGAGFGMSGFCWISYDLMRDAGITVEALTMLDRIGYKPRLLGVVDIDHPCGDEVGLCWINGNPSNPDWYYTNSTFSPKNSPNYYWHIGDNTSDFHLLRWGSQPMRGKIVIDLSDAYLYSPPDAAGMDMKLWTLWVHDERPGKCAGMIKSMALETTTQTLVSPYTPMRTRPQDPETVPATQVPLCCPEGVAIGKDGAIFMAESVGARIRKLAGQQLTLYAGSPEMGGNADEDYSGPATSATLSAPSDVSCDSQGNLYIADVYRVRKVDAGGTIRTFARGFGAATGIDAADAHTVYVADSAKHMIIRASDTGTTAVVAGTGIAGYSGDGGPALNARLDNPTDVVYNPIDRSLYIIDATNHRIRKVDPAGIISTAYSPLPYEQSGFSRLACGKDGTVYFTAGYIYGPGSVMKLTAGGADTVASFGLLPTGLAIDASNTAIVSFSDKYGSANWLLSVDKQGVTTTLAGIGTLGYGLPVSIHMGDVSVAITRQPADQVVKIGKPARFSVSASGYGKLHCQWGKKTSMLNFFEFHDDGHIAGATSSTLSISPVGEDDFGVYRCVVSGDVETAVTQNVQLLLRPVNCGVADWALYP